MTTPERVVGWTGVAILLVAAAVVPARPIALVVLAVGWLGLASRDAGSRWRGSATAWAACLPVVVALAWPSLLPPDLPMGAACIDPRSPIAWRRVGEAVAVLAVVGVLARSVRSSRRELGLVVPDRAMAALATAGVGAIALGSLWLGPLLAEPFFGRLAFPVPPAALVPALIFGVANGVAEEVAYRGALLRWLERSIGLWPALVVQGLAFGLAHAGPDVVALLPLHVALLGAAGVVAGIVAVRTGSLALPIAAHIGADIALYYGLACRPAAA